MRWNATTAALISILAVGSCLPREATGPEGGSGQARLLVRADVSGTAIATVVVEITAPDIATPLVFNLTTVGGVAAGTITVPAGSQRTVALRAYDAGGVQTHSGSATLTIAPGVNPPVAILLTPLLSDLPVTVTLGSFGVTISPAAVTLLPGDTAHLTATILDATGTPVTGQVVWATLAPSVASVVSTGAQTGRVTASSGGQTTVVAAYGGVAGSTAITVAVPTMVQHVSTPSTRSSAGAGLNIFLPNKTLAHNCLIVAVHNGGTPGLTISVSDDQGNTYSAGPAVSLSGGHPLAVFYALNARAGVQHITVSFAGGSADRIAAVASEWYNVALANAFDGGSQSVSTSPTASWAAGTLTTTANGDLVYQTVADEGPSGPYASYAAGGGFALASADLIDGMAAQYTVKGGAGATNPTVTANGSGPYSSVALALKGAVAGTAPGPGIRIAHMHVGNTGSGRATIPLQAPSSGNLLVFAMTRDADVSLTSVADGKGNSYVDVPGSPLSNGFGGTERMLYAANASTSTSMTLTVTFASTIPAGSAFIVYDVTGAATNPFDVSSTALGMQTTTGNLATVSITPAGGGELVIARGDQNVGTITGLLGSGFFFDNPTWVGQDEGGPAGGAGADFTLDSQSGHFYTVNASPLTFVWTEIRAAYEWETIAAAFKGASP